MVGVTAGVFVGVVSTAGAGEVVTLSNLRSPIGAVDDEVGCMLIGVICFLAAKRPREKAVPTTKRNTVKIVIIETTVTKYFWVSEEVGQTMWSNSFIDSFIKDIETRYNIGYDSRMRGII